MTGLRWFILFALSAAAACAQDGGFQVRIAERPDGVSVRKAVKRNALPSLDVHVEASGPLARQVGLEVDGLLMGIATNADRVSPFRAVIPWFPWHGNGGYMLTAHADEADNPTSHTLHTVRVEVNGMFFKTPAPRDFMIKLYRQRFGLELASPALARFCSPDTNLAHWVSAAWIGDTLYEIHLYDDLRDVATRRPVNREPDDDAPGEPVTRPAGTYKMLVVFFDYEDSGITEPEAMTALRQGAAEVNARYARYLSGSPPKPLLQLDVEGVFVAYRPYANRPLMNPNVLKRRTGRVMSAYDLVAQVDLHTGAATTNTGARAAALRSYTGKGAEGVNVWVEVRRPEELQTHLSRTLFDYELNQVFGWERSWPCGNGSYAANNFAENPPPFSLPTLLFGWHDLDGDRVPEIVDLTPYGLKSKVRPLAEKR
ncbi:MAG: hypothetical protein V1929_13025 [bacterium]